ncbi:MAG: gamma-glutamyltransferase [Bosea sp.]|jgi:gamma-glutamyltranspeptidase|nr:gamma-glutamyltransferase [Bosea sp. (in: a-proteobacteria)]
MPETPVFSSAAVAAPHHLATETGRSILAQGGNAVEAMIAMAATIAVVYPHMNGIGGDGFWLVRDARGKVVAIEACGPAGALATIRRYREKGLDAIPPRGPDAALTVAGAIGGWQVAAELAAQLGGRLPLRLLTEDAVRHARSGVAISASEARYRIKDGDGLYAAPGFQKLFRTAGKPLEAGAIRKNEALANTIEQITRAGLDDFYRGEVAREMAAELERMGAPVSRADLAAYKARTTQPLSLRLDGVTVHNFPPPTQGLAALVILGLIERLDLKRCDSFEHIHALVEASKRALGLRNRVITDPARMAADPASFLAPSWLDREAAKIDMKRAAEWPLKAGDGDTIWMGAIDRDGNSVSYIQSVYWEYGSGCVLEKTGVTWQNRGVSFSLDPAALNALLPGAKPFHTLNPPMAVFDDGRVVSYGCMGGDGQPQFQAQVFSRYRMGMGVADAVDAPRFLFGKTWGANSTTLKIENRFDHVVVARLAAAGHALEEWGVPHDDQFGHAGLLVRHPAGHVEATHDPRSDGDAKGL